MKPDTDNAANGAHAALEQIEQLARSYWEQEGRPEGRHLEHWLRAEAEVAARDSGGPGES